MKPSLRAQLTAGLVFSLLVVSAAQWVAAAMSIRGLLEGYAATRLQHDTEGLLAALRFGAGGRPHLDARYVAPVFRRPLSGHYFTIVVDPAPPLRSRSLWDSTLPVPALRPGAVRRSYVSGPSGRPLLMLTSAFTKQGRELRIAVAEDLGPVYAGARKLGLRYASAAAAAILVLVVLQLWIVRRALRPLGRAREQLVRLGRGEIATLDETLPREIRPLVEEINRLLDVQRRRLERSRNALGNLAHGLKTPLTHLAQITERLDSELGSEASAQARERIGDLRRIIERELRRARLAGAGPATAWVDLAVEIPALLEVLRGIYRSKGVRIEARIAPETVFPADREDLLELAGNLVDNACKWARGRVRVTAAPAPAGGDGLVLVVEDDGPGIGEREREVLIARGVRADETVPGHGLGLSIVRDILELYGGRLSLDRSPALGGLRARVELTAPGGS